MEIVEEVSGMMFATQPHVRQHTDIHLFLLSILGKGKHKRASKLLVIDLLETKFERKSRV